jgi:hydroxyacylglutathione hydrolase
VCIDTPEADVYLREAARGWTITQIWNTHWHPDHAGGNEAIKAATGCTITAPAGDAAKIAGVDRTVARATWCASARGGFGHRRGRPHPGPCGLRARRADRLRRRSPFALGCGRMFEGTAPQFWDSLSRLKALPPETAICCAHEYTASNARFALHADPDNGALRDYAAEIERLRADAAHRARAA